MAVAYYNSGNWQSGATGTTWTVSFDVGTDDNRAIYVFTTKNAFDSYQFTGVTYNGVSLTNIGSAGGGSGMNNMTCWRLVNPASGTNNIVATFTNTPAGQRGMAAYALSGVNQSDPEDVVATANVTSDGSNTTVSVVTTVADTYIVAGFHRILDSMGSADRPTDPTTTARWDFDSTLSSRYFSGCDGAAATAKTYTMTWAGSTRRHAIVAAAVKEEGAGGAAGFMDCNSGFWGY